MIRRSVPLLALVLLASACQEPDRPTTLRTGGYHIVDDRGWAVGSDVTFSATSGFGGILSVELEQDTDVIAEGGDVDLYWGGGEGMVTGEVVAEGTFDLVVTNSFGVEQERVELPARDVDGYRLGVLLDDCPEYPDLVMQEQPTILAGASVNVAPAPVDADGNQLLGSFDFDVTNTIDADADTDWEGFESGWWGGYASLFVQQSGDVTFTIDGQEHVFPVDVVDAADIVALEIAAIPEKHGVADESLLCALGVTADGRVVHGVDADWAGGGTAQTFHAPNDTSVQACFGGTCATWDGAR
jgi:hypothetical protein